MKAIRLIVALLLTMIISSASAQPAELPLVVVMKGDLYRWYEGDTSLYGLSNWGYNDEATVSPDGSLVAYHSYARVTVEAIQRTGGFGGGKGPGNIWVIDPVTGDGTRLIDQPADAVFLSDNGQDNAIIRSKPFWSPDGTKVGWTEIQYPAGDAAPSLWVYDFATAAAQKLTDLPIHQSVNGIYDGFWTDGGIVLDGVMWDSGDMVWNYPVYTESGELLQTISLEVSESHRAAEVVPVEYNGRDYLGVQYHTPANDEQIWTLYDLLTGEGINPANEPRAYSALAPDESIYFVKSSQFAGGYQVFDQNDQPIDLPVDENSTIVAVALSQDGEAVAYRTYNKVQGGSSDVFVWRDGILTTVPKMEEEWVDVREMLWSPIVRRVVDEA
jgi:hypothetical protein